MGFSLNFRGWDQKMQGVKRDVPDEFWTDLTLIYPTRGGGKKLAEKYGVDGGFVCRMAKARGIKAERSTRLAFYRESLKNRHFESMLREWVPQKGGVKLLSEMFGISTGMINDASDAIGVNAPKTILQRYHKENLRVDYFDALDSVRAYWLGYLFADGCVAEDKKTGNLKGLFLGCKTSDEDHILFLREELRSQHAILRAFKKDKQGNILYDKSGEPIQKTSVCITSSELAEILRDIYGIFPQKSSLNPLFPHWVTPELLPHFARGVFDGDGCCWQGEVFWEGVLRLKQILYWVGSELFISGLRDRIVESVPVPKLGLDLDKGVWKTRWTTLVDIHILYNWMYPTKNVICLPRKRIYLEKMIFGEPVPETGGEPMEDFDESMLEITDEVLF